MDVNVLTTPSYNNSRMSDVHCKTKFDLEYSGSPRIRVSIADDCVVNETLQDDAGICIVTRSQRSLVSYDVV